MIASDFKLIPFAVLHEQENMVLQGLDSLPITYRKDLLHDPRERYPYLYFMLLKHWPKDVAHLGIRPEELFYNQYYWLLRLAKQLESLRGFDEGCEQQKRQMLETTPVDVDPEVLQSIAEKVTHEFAANEKEIVVSFSDFSVSEVKRRFGIRREESKNHFAKVEPVSVSSLLKETLEENVPLALAISTEKARSEFIVAPVLSELRRRFRHKISLFSGVEWNVDSDQGLRGYCDFLLCGSPEQLVIEAPVVAIVEAKKEDMTAGIGQCLAEMVAARIFNERQQNAVPTIYGVVTTGNIWKFLRLEGNTAYLDTAEYHINEFERIVGILMSMFPGLK